MIIIFYDPNVISMTCLGTGQIYVMACNNINCVMQFLQNLTADELADIPTCNLAETVHNKWMQASGKRGSDLFVATTDDWARAFMQMTNYRTFLCGGPSGTGPSKHDLKLKRAMASHDGKKIADAINNMPGAAEVSTRVPHLEGEEVFGSVKRKLDMPVGCEGDSHRPDKVNFSHPRVQTRSAAARMNSEQSPRSSSPVPFTTRVLETDCDTSKWHIARISHKSRKRCHAVQAGNGNKCKMLIAKGGKATAAPTYRGTRTEYKGTKPQTDDFWFCPDQIARCVMGPKRFFVIDRPEIPEVWPVLSGTNLTRSEILELQEAGFRLQSTTALSPRRLFTTSKVFEPVLWTHPRPLHADRVPSSRNGKNVRRNTKAPTEAHRNQWESARNVKANILRVNLLPYPGLGAIIVLQSGVEPDDKLYNITLCNFPSCTCPHYASMNSAAVGRRGQYVNCKHLYYIFRFFCKLDYKVDTYIHAPTLSLDEVKKILLAAGIIKTEE